MSGELAKKEMETSNKPTTSNEKALSGESRNKEKRKKKKKEKKTSSHKSHRSGDKKMRKVVYYETDTSSPSTSDSDATCGRRISSPSPSLCWRSFSSPFVAGLFR